MADQSGTRSFVVAGTVIPARPLAPALHVVATPIGNLGDVTIRALETIAGADLLACEDTRITRRLLDRYGIARRPLAYHEHNEAEAGPRLVAALKEGRSVALVSDAGTPLVSDPGFRLVREALAAGITVVPVPGASAPLAALVASGLPSDAFLFAGFLPQKAGPRDRRLAELAAIPATLIFFESPNRLPRSLAAMAEALGPRPAAVCRELTKAHEAIVTGTLAELAARFAETGPPKGEVVVVIGPPAAGAASEIDADALLLELSGTMAPARAAAEAARMTGLRKGDLYRRLTELRAGDEH